MPDADDDRTLADEAGDHVGVLGQFRAQHLDGHRRAVVPNPAAVHDAGGADAHLFLDQGPGHRMAVHGIHPRASQSGVGERFDPDPAQQTRLSRCSRPISCVGPVAGGHPPVMRVFVDDVRALRFDDGTPVRAASGIAPLADGWMVAQDDATHAAWRLGPSRPCGCCRRSRASTSSARRRAPST